MARNVVTYRFTLEDNPYVADRGVSQSLAARFVAPPDITDAGEIEAIVTAVGGILGSGGGICSDTNTFTPRKIVLIRSDGSSLSLVVPARQNIIAIADAAATAVEAAGQGLQVECIKLEGESILNLYDELATTTIAPVAGVPPVQSVGTKNIKYTGTMLAYEADVVFGAVTPQKFKMDTNAVDANGLGAYPVILGAAGANCLGEIGAVPTCTGKNKTRTPRHYNVTLLVTNYKGGTGNLSTVMKVPNADSAAADILQCGVALASLPSTICIGYKGESYNRLHRLLPT